MVMHYSGLFCPVLSCSIIRGLGQCRSTRTGLTVQTAEPDECNSAHRKILLQDTPLSMTDYWAALVGLGIIAGIGCSGFLILRLMLLWCLGLIVLNDQVGPETIGDVFGVILTVFVGAQLLIYGILGVKPSIRGVRSLLVDPFCVIVLVDGRIELKRAIGTARTSVQEIDYIERKSDFTIRQRVNDKVLSLHTAKRSYRVAYYDGVDELVRVLTTLNPRIEVRGEWTTVNSEE